MKKTSFRGPETVLPISAIILCTVISIIALLNRLSVPSVARGWVGSQYFVNYDRGFVRRGLPGYLVDKLMGGASYEKIESFGRFMTFLALVSVLYIVSSLVKREMVPVTKTWILLIALFGPLSIGILIRDIGRYDTFGYIYFGVLIFLANRFQKNSKFSYIYLLVLVGGLLLVTLTQEYLLAFCIVPTVFFASTMLLFQYSATSLWKKMPLIVISLLSISITAILSITRTPSGEQIKYFHERAGTGGKWNAIQSLALDISGQRDLVTADLTRHTWTNLFYIALFLFFSSLIMSYVQSSKSIKNVVLFSCLASGLLVSNLGVDLRRPWSLAMWAVITTASLIQIQKKQSQLSANSSQGHKNRSESETSRAWKFQLALYFCIFFQALPNTPINVWGITFQLNDTRSFYHSFIDFADPQMLGGK